MSVAQPHALADEEDDLLAAEFVLGVLPFADHALLERRAEIDGAFAARVAHWQERLLPLADNVAGADLGPGIKRALDARLFGTTAATAAAARPAGRIWRNLALWRGLAGAATTAFLFSMVLPWLSPDPVSDRATDAVSDRARLVASLADGASDVHYMAVYDPDDGWVGLSHVSGTPAAGHDFELWVIHGNDAPRSLGVIPAGAPSAHLVLAAPLRAAVEAGARLAISLEPSGGSPSGAPTGMVVAAGDLHGL